MTTNRLGVVLNHVASLRQARRAKQPDPVVAAALAEQAGADAIIVQLREDRRHIQERDVRLLRQTVTTGLTLRMAATQEMLKLAYDIKPDCVTLLPERADEVTAESGLDIGYHRDHIRKYVQNLRDGDIAVSILLIQISSRSAMRIE
ncbi:MAG: pyridoxine 5'-phosphate synthase [Myxococcota bacterium]